MVVMAYPASLWCSLINQIAGKATEAVLRCSPEEDSTNGFFVSCFIRQCGARPNANEAEATVAERNIATGSPSVTTSTKRKIPGEDSGDNIVLTAPPSSRRRKKRKRKT